GNSANGQIEQHGHGQTQRHSKRDADYHERRVPDRFPEKRVVTDHPPVIRQSDESRRVENIEIAKADDDREQQRSSDENEEADNPRARAKRASNPFPLKTPFA